MRGCPPPSVVWLAKLCGGSIGGAQTPKAHVSRGVARSIASIVVAAVLAAHAGSRAECVGSKRKRAAPASVSAETNLVTPIRQYLGRPATFAGVERAFSKAGKLHDDLKSAQSDSSLEHALLAGFNCE